MENLQAHFRMPVYDATPASDLIQHATERVTRGFYAELDKRLGESPGGLIVGPPRVRVETKGDPIWGGYITHVSMAANVEELPEPPEYRFFGGPADGQIVRTHGERTWLVPVMPPLGVMSYAEPNEPKALVAEYRRQGDTAAYFYERTYEQ